MHKNFNIVLKLKIKYFLLFLFWNNNMKVSILYKS